MARQPIFGCAVSASNPVAMTVDIGSGVIDFDDAYVIVPSVSGLAIAAADPSLDRYDAVVVDSTGTVSVLTGTAGNAYTPEDVTKLTLAVVPVAAGVTSIAAVQDVRVNPTSVPEFSLPQFSVANTMGYTYLSGAQPAADPGAGKLGFDNALSSSIAHLYASYYPCPGRIVGGVANFTTIKYWLQGAGSFPFNLRLWSKTQPNVFMVVQVNSFTDHLSWADLGVTYLWQPQAEIGPVSGNPPLSTTAIDTVVQIEEAPVSTATLYPSLRVQASDQTIASNYGLDVPADYEIGSGFVLELATDAALEIT